MTATLRPRAFHCQTRTGTSSKLDVAVRSHAEAADSVGCSGGSTDRSTTPRKGLGRAYTDPVKMEETVRATVASCSRGLVGHCALPI
jgi:hypothetical protein